MYPIWLTHYISFIVADASVYTSCFRQKLESKDLVEKLRKEAPVTRLQQNLDRLEREERQSVSGYIAIKGTRNGLRLTLEPETPFKELLRALADRLAESPSFFRGASIAVDTSQRALRSSERMQLEDLLALYQMSIIPLDKLIEKRKEVKVVTQPLPAPSSEVTMTQSTDYVQRDPRESEDTLFLRRTVRSGQAIHHHSNVIVLGDVNPGAEIMAGGDIIVWGVLRGMVHAGYPDNQTALVCSLQLSPVQLRIAHLLSRPPEGFEAQQLPEVASIRQEQIIVETWISGHPPRK
jgi:septum site-determining protein MinC